MKRKFGIAILIYFIGVLLLSSCSGGIMFDKLFRNKEKNYSCDEREVANVKMDILLDTIKNKDKVTLKSLFSKNVITQLIDFDQSIYSLFDYFQGDFVSYDDMSGSGGEITYDYGNKQEILYSSYDVKTSHSEYRFAIKTVIIDASDKDNEGIHSLYIIKKEDDIDSQLGYIGDNKFTPGIHIGVKNVLPNEDNSIIAVSVDS